MSSADDSASAHQHRIDRHFDATSRYWKDLYEEESLYGVIHQQRRALALRWLAGCGLPAGGRVVDVGCGAGVLARDIANLGFTVDGVDSSQAMIDVAGEMVAGAGLGDRVHLRVADAHDLPFRDDAFDCVISLGVLPYMHTPSRALSEMARVVTPGGYVLVNSDNLLRLNHLLDPLRTPLLARPRRVARQALTRLGRPPRGLPSRRLSSGSLTRLIEDAGLRIVRYQTLGFGPFSFIGWEPLPDRVGRKLHHRLQSAADRGVPVLRSTGAQELVLARRGETARPSS